MNIIEAILLGIVQGLTEFLPISSTAHLTLVGKIFGLISKENPEHWTAFIAVIQIGTLISILVYFFKEILSIIQAFVKENLVNRKNFSTQTYNAKMGWLIIVGTIPVVIIGLAFKHQIEGVFTKNLIVIAGSLIIFALILAIAEKTVKFKKNIEDITLLDSFLIGVAQCFALIPGASRSGTTITGGLFLGLKRDVAAKFSFLLSIPAVFASGLLEFYQSIAYFDSSMMFNMLIATIFAAISGYLAIDFLIKFLKKNTTFIFIYYRIFIGIIILFLIYSNYINSF